MRRLSPLLRVPSARRIAAAAAPALFLTACGTASLSSTPVADTAPAAPAAAAAPASSPAPVSPSTTVPGAPNCPMFPSDNVWNTDISQLPVNKHSAAWMRSMHASSLNLHPDFGPNPGGTPFGIPFNVVTSKHPLIKVHFSQPSESNRAPYPFGSDIRIEPGDRHAIMINKDTCKLYELYLASFSGGRASAYAGATWNLNSNHLRPDGWTSADAAGLPILPGLLNYNQVKEAAATHTPITHAIRFTAEPTRDAFIWPARHSAGSGSSASLPPMGARFRLKASFSVTRFCSGGGLTCRSAKAILTEMKHYGMILADNGSDWFFQGSANPQWPDSLVEMLKRIPASAFEAVDESCLKTSANSGQATAKPGCPIG
jgi:hypothetical protein